MKDYLTPMMKQYFELKEKAENKLLFFRMGDFYELFYEDAKIAAPILGVALTSRDKTSNIPMCGIPYHAINSYIFKLTNAGHSVAICEQVENPKDNKIFKREIVKVVTPALVYDSDILDNKKAMYLMSIYETNEKAWSYSYIDYTTGEFKTNTVLNIDELVKEIYSIDPKEIIFEKHSKVPNVLQNILNNLSFTVFELDKKNNINNILNYIIIDSRISEDELYASKLILYYLKQTQFLDKFAHIKNLNKITSSDYMSLDEFTIKNLEIVNTLIPVIDKTITAMGGRFIRNTILHPLRNKESIEYRLNIVEKLFNNFNSLNEIRNILKKISDIERLLSKISIKNYRPLEFRNLLQSTLYAYDLFELTNSLNIESYLIDENLINFSKNVLNYLNQELPNSVNSSGIFKKNYNKELDELIELHENSRLYLAQMEKNEREKTKINSLKIKYNKVFGYYIEVSNANLNLVPNYYQRKQTLVNGERYITEELSILEVKLISAQEKRILLEKQLLDELITKLINEYLEEIILISKKVAFIDLLAAFSYLALNNNYIKPSLSNDFNLIVKDLRHPVMETIDEFIPNDIELNKDNYFHVITGPNMAGKSTVMRSLALVTILSHTGSFIPASYAEIPITDKVFTRVGATDYILKGQSTFMVEMIETANIIHTATSSSLIILDEIGRGTSTIDGISIAWAIAEYIHNKIKAKCMFATHYHELTSLEHTLQAVKNYSMAVEEQDNGLFFLRKLVAKPASSSYGVQVAEMAGLPSSIIKRAFSIMNKFNLNKSNNILNIEKAEQEQLSLFDGKNAKNNILMKELNKLNINSITPIEALNRIYEWKKKIEETV